MKQRPGNYGQTDRADDVMRAVSDVPVRTPPPGGGSASCPPANAIWCIGLVGIPAGGSFDFTYDGDTITVNYGTSVSAVQALVDAVTAWEDNILVGGTTTAYRLTFQNDFGNQEITDVDVDASDLLGHGVAALPYLIQQGRE